MSSNLIPERPLIVSPTLAATIGLEEAVMLHIISEQLSVRDTEQQRNLTWVTLTQQQLLDLMPFWAWIDIRRVQQSLQNLGMLEVQAHGSAPDGWRFAINQRTDQRPRTAAASSQPANYIHNSHLNKQAASPARHATAENNGQAAYIAPDWQPDEEWLALCRQHGVPDAFVLSLVPGFVMYWRDRAQSRFSWGNVFYKHALKEWRQEQSRRGAAELETDMSARWRPSADAMAILENAGVSRAFIEDAVPEFVLYWRERGARNGAWNTRFIEHIRRQWAKYSAALHHDGQPRPIPADWQPSDEVFEILDLAEIDREFACRKLPEFVLYWRDTGQAHASWNTRFLQFIKYTWARRPETAGTGLIDAKDEQHSGQGRQGLEAAFRRFTDRSWAE